MIGLMDSVYLWYKRCSKRSMVCPLKQDCRSLYNLPQAKFLGIHWDIWGMFYYATLFVLALQAVNIPFESLVLRTLVVVGLIVSGYLLYIQYSVKNYCTWCLLSELVTVLLAITIFIMGVSTR